MGNKRKDWKEGWIVVGSSVKKPWLWDMKKRGRKKKRKGKDMEG